MKEMKWTLLALIFLIACGLAGYFSVGTATPEEQRYEVALAEREADTRPKITGVCEHCQLILPNAELDRLRFCPGHEEPNEYLMNAEIVYEEEANE